MLWLSPLRVSLTALMFVLRRSLCALSRVHSSPLYDSRSGSRTAALVIANSTSLGSFLRETLLDHADRRFGVCARSAWFLCS